MTRRRGRCHVRVKGPITLRERAGKIEIWRGLATGEHKVAVRRYHAARAEITRYLEGLAAADGSEFSGSDISVSQALELAQ